MATMEYYGAAQMGPQGRNGKTNNYEQSNINNHSQSSLFQNSNLNNTIHENTTNPPSEDAYRQIIPSAASGDGDMLQIPSASVDSTGNYTDDGILKCSDDDVDSALLAALRDPRERVSLLRTEQVLIDFMNQPDGYMEIGGPYNSIVLSPTGSITAKATNSNKLLNNDFFGGRTLQTSFQRCWLHRLADRFNITRENGCLREDSIRLVKIRESRIPRKLLAQLDPSEYALPSQPMDDSSSSMGGLTQQFSSTLFLPGNNNNNIGSPSQLAAAAAAATSAPPKAKPKKMKIMKRNSSSSFGSTGSLNKGSNGGKSTSAAATASRKSKNFSDKEKAYAEARARIFNESSSSANSGNGEPTKAAAANTATPDVAVVSACNPLAATSSSAATSPITSKTPSATSSSAPSPSSSPPPAAVVAGLERAVEIDESPAVPTLTTPAPAVTSQPQLQQQLLPQQGTGPRRAAAASAGGGTKATYRNRRQEESDPDFQRGFHLNPMVPAYDTGFVYGYQAQQQYYVYPDDAAAGAGATYYATPSASRASTTSGTPSLTNNSKGQSPYASYSQATAYVSNDGNIQAAATSNTIGASTAVGADGRRGRGSLNAAAPSAASRGYYNPYAYSAASTAATSSRQGDATTTTSASQAVPPYEEFPALR